MLSERQASDDEVSGVTSRPASDDGHPRAHSRVGDVLNGKWKLERLLGVGGMGAVYAGLHRNGARAAIKVLHRYLAKHEPVRTRFLREGYAANRVTHPSVVKVLDDDIVVGGPDDGTAYLVMELLVGESLDSWSRRGAVLGEHDFLMVADVVLEVLDVAHRSGVVHRDIKPDNMFITREGAGTDRIKVLDFGLARLLEGQSMTVHGVALGSPPFMSPEQAAGRDVDGRTDLFALAASGFRLITGQRIHDGASAIDLVEKMGKLRAPRVRTVAPQISESTARVLDRALEFRREDRYESAEAMRADVQRALAVVDAGSRRTMPFGRDARSIELRTCDLEAVPSLDPSALEEVRRVTPSAVSVAPIPSEDLRASEPGAPRSPAVVPFPPTQPMQAVDAGALFAPRRPAGSLPPALTDTGVFSARSFRKRPAARAWSAVLQHEALLARALLGIGVIALVGALFAAMWVALRSPPPDASASSPATTHLSPGTSPSGRPTRAGKRSKH